MYSANQETLIFLTTIYGGILIGFIYELYKLFRKIFRPKTISTNIQDVFFWSIILMVVFYTLIVTNQADLRYYNFMGFMIGVIVYHCLLASCLRRTLLGIVNTLANYTMDVMKICMYPFLVGKRAVKIIFWHCKKNTDVLYCKLGKQKGEQLCKRKEERKRAKFLL
ncbi:MAG: spore cortex biosynthesis protein YabQ [Clostridiales bacterium]|nr:spore cortex biosynthesis protein YabQ [Clostridiales bacterium]